MHCPHVNHPPGACTSSVRSAWTRTCSPVSASALCARRSSPSQMSGHSQGCLTPSAAMPGAGQSDAGLRAVRSYPSAPLFIQILSSNGSHGGLLLPVAARSGRLCRFATTPTRPPGADIRPPLPHSNRHRTGPNPESNGDNQTLHVNDIAPPYPMTLRHCTVSNV